MGQKTRLIEIEEKQELGEYISLIDDHSKETLEGFLLKTYNFSVDGLLDLNRHRQISEQEVSDERLPFIESIIGCAKSLVMNYDTNDPFNLFSTTLETLKFLNLEDKQRYINQFKGFIEREESSKNDPIMNLIIERVAGVVAEKYKTEFERLVKNNVKKGDPLYQKLVERLKKDLERVVDYTLEKLDQNEKYHPSAKNIEYGLCFGKSGNTKQIPSPDYVIMLIGNSDNPQSLVDQHGIPLGMERKGNKAKDKTTVTLYYGNPSNPTHVKVEHPQGLGKEEEAFYLGLGRIITPIPQFAQPTRKFIDSLAKQIS